MGRAEIARYEQLLHFPQCFSKACFPGVSKSVIVWEWVERVHDVKHSFHFNSKYFHSQSNVSVTLKNKAFENSAKNKLYDLKVALQILGQKFYKHTKNYTPKAF